MVMRNSTIWIAQKPRSVFLQNCRQPMQRMVNLPLIPGSRSEAVVRVTCHDWRQWGKCSGVVVVSIELAGPALPTTALAFSAHVPHLQRDAPGVEATPQRAHPEKSATRFDTGEKTLGASVRHKRIFDSASL